jgi:FlaG/FlaF family flagellin (archaellin)
MNLVKLYRRRRAVSPILAAILLIGLAVAAGAVLFVVVLPMIQSSGELKFGTTTFSDVDADGSKDKLVLTLTNELAESVAITSITIEGKAAAGSWPGTTITDVNTTTTFPFNIATSQSEIGMIFDFDPGTYEELRIRVDYSIESVAQDPLYSTTYDVAV